MNVLNSKEKWLDKQQPLACAAAREDQGILVSFCSDTPEVQCFFVPGICFTWWLQ